MRLFLVTLLAVLAPGVASANMGAPTWGGSLTGEPTGIRDIAIQHEDLVLDLRPVPAGALAAIAATYHLDNRGPAATLALVFAAGERGIADFAIAIDGAAVPDLGLHPVDGPLPPSWQAPVETPVPGGGTELYGVRELRHGGDAVGFSLTVPPGAHTVAITYRAEALHRHAGGPTLLHQLAYVLAPARSWAGFGGLDVTVRVPSGWDTATTPALPRAGDVLHATFASIPADAIALAIRAPAPWYLPVRVLGVIALAAVALGGGFVVAAWSRRRSRPDAIYPSLTRAAGLGFAWAAVFTVVGILAIAAPVWTLPATQGDAMHGYAAVFYAALVVLGALALWPIGAAVAWWVDRRLVLAARAAS